MLTLYVKTGCPFAAVVLKKVDDLDLTIEEKNIADDGVLAELEALSGDTKSPFLVDSEKGIQMGESSDIAAYLEKTYGDGMAKASDDDTDAPNVCMLE